ncbi:Spy/CpxP family protein refolding chaperone [Roseateles oligotrophus]|uniref:Spy/CpxP family protein refolding chaperone n=1 Tax=Roseateles oligotrophus TaxID=1769250 RepID=A0ABT2YBH3_9BURK|nr:Spy/CpxP family protein refolding chaperone [Roseateles oligotrophus]MCV2367142.1 Spy/CpxP family protein refolding chaperone [Roseateles oligotrophus]
MTVINTSRLFHLGKAVALASALAVGGLSAMNAQAMGAMGGRAEMGPHGGSEMMMAGRMEHMLDMVDASDTQRAQIKQIMAAARQDLKSQRAGGRNLHEQSMSLLTAANIDASAIEALRQQMSAQHEEASKRMSQAMVDAARVLTPEQRAKLAERMKKMQARMQEHMSERQQHSATQGH